MMPKSRAAVILVAALCWPATASVPHSFLEAEWTIRQGANDGKARCHGAAAKRGLIQPLIVVGTCSDGIGPHISDKNGAATGFTYETAADKLNRLKTVTRANGGKSVFTYVDTAGQVSVTTETDQFAVNDKKHLEKVEYDGLGRGFRVSAGAGTALIQTETSFDGLGRKYRSYLPYGSGESATKYQEMEYDGTGRVKKVTHQPGLSAVTTAYALETATVTDEAGKKVARSVDGLGRLVKVVEDPGVLGYVTEYAYNGQDKLRTVVQKGAGTAAIVSRSYDYDTLGRLRRAVNPERGTTRYKYDGNGNVLSRREDDGTMATNGYDEWNRLTGRTYAGALTKPGKWCYDGLAYSSGVCTGTVLANSKGMLTGAGSDDSVVGYAHDAYGRVIASSQTTPAGGSVYPFTYSYYLDDSLETERYPSAKQIGHCYDTHGRVSWVSLVQGAAECLAGTGPATYVANLVTYASHGATKQVVLGNGLFENSTFNDRNQPLSMKLGVTSGSGGIWQQDYDFGTTANNGNVQKLTLKLPGKPDVVTQYGYDALNRLALAMENADVPGNGCVANNTVWCQGFGYDVAGNVLVGAEYGVAAPLGRPSSYGTSTNRIANPWWLYDGRGNVSQIPYAVSTPDKMLFDGEDRMVQYCANSAAACDTVAAGGSRTIYRYDVLGKRVRKEGVGGDLTFVYDVFGKLAAEYGGSSGGAGRKYLTVDHLGSTRVVTDGSGVVGERRDYLAFGGELGSAVGSRAGVAGYGVDLASRMKFTAKERDSESGLDYFGARYFSGTQGRFTSADPTFMTRQRISDSQQWNLYAYTRNNPLKYVDPDGRDLRLAGGVSAKDRQYLVHNLARLYMTEKGRSYIDRVERSPYSVDLSVGKLDRTRLSSTSEHVTGGVTRYQTSLDPGTGQKSLNAAGQPGAPDAFPAMQVVIDKSNTSDMGMDPAKVLAHELGGHTSNVMDLAGRDPNNPSITELDRAKDEADSKKAENVGKLPGKPTPEAVKKIEDILKERNP